MGTEDKAAQRQHPAQDPGGSLWGNIAPPDVSPEPSQAQSRPLLPVLTSVSPLPPPEPPARQDKPPDASSNPPEIARDPKPHDIALVVKRDEKFKAVINSCKETVLVSSQAALRRVPEHDRRLAALPATRFIQGPESQRTVCCIDLLVLNTTL